ncbi:MAG: hypothetical protein N4A64_12950 [Marinisporobacter sp.]|jgi:hypothetical protein|nr:hypothetical protein [Marinisporobacter sp.]
MVVDVSMYKKTKTNPRVITGYILADKMYADLFEGKYVKDKEALRKLLWREFRQSFVKNEIPLKNFI